MHDFAHRFSPRRFVFNLTLVWVMLLAASATSFGARIEPLEIATKAGVRTFTVEIATTDEERAQGLMYRRELPEGRGMLFDFGRDQDVAMWMKNTFVSLDMIFIRADGSILRIAENTEPQSTRIIPSGGPVRGVLEVVAGTARKLGIAPGDRVSHPMFKAR